MNAFRSGGPVAGETSAIGCCWGSSSITSIWFKFSWVQIRHAFVSKSFISESWASLEFSRMLGPEPHNTFEEWRLFLFDSQLNQLKNRLFFYLKHSIVWNFSMNFGSSNKANERHGSSSVCSGPTCFWVQVTPSPHDWAGWPTMTRIKGLRSLITGGGITITILSLAKNSGRWNNHHFMG